ncbi:glycoside hydrolase family 38 C-terminal domain-containing protein [Arachnia propionica]|uniref:Alpha-mannosidase n=1 Tax=Arachnia propionica TaxID=1750 RepID=A0A3P1WYB6_9ACTN|nr:glycoside hydrolase family 38 C-terminal domain-containing protein [Arachnia propionica]RRD50918.1 alpha-mannosidase [Arachnia propionica]
MHAFDTLVLERVERVKDDRVLPLVDRTVGTLQVEAWEVPGEPVPPHEARLAEYQPITLPHPWGAAWSTWWFRLRGTMPDDAPRGSVRLDVDLGFADAWPGNQCEGLLFTSDLTVLKAVNSRNRSCVVDADPGTEVEFLIEAAANPDLFAHGCRATPMGDVLTAPDTPIYQLRSAEFRVRDETLWGLFHDLDLLWDLARHLPEGSTRRAVICRHLDRAMDVLDLHDVPGSAGACRQALAPVWQAPAVASALSVTAIGHAHIDSAWLWPVRETVRKVARTFSNVVALAREYPDFTFTATSAQQYAWLQERHPEVFDAVRRAVAAGQWFPSGGMWVESDVNLPGGEALIRQFTMGTRFFQRELGTRSRTLWLPDSFGYPGNLPQIAARCGMTGFLTQKLSWNQHNQLPHSTMWWEGIDGTRIFTHFPPVNCYDSEISAEEVKRAVDNYKEKGWATRQVIPFGYGDGGGGPTAQMVERIRRLADLEGAPRVTMGDPDSFFDAARAEYPDAPVHVGELYLEFHRGIFTSQLEMKQGNRRSEHALREVEFLWSLALLAGAPVEDFPAAELETLWRQVLLNQFHDILPGSSIAWVHRVARQEYREILTRLAVLADRAVTALRSPTTGSVAAVVNPHAHPVTRVLEVDGQPRLVTAGPLAITPLADAVREPDSLATVRRDGEMVVLENSRLRVVIDGDGDLAQVTDLTKGRDLLLPGMVGNQLRAFEDVPNAFDAWDIERHYLNPGNEIPVPPADRVEILGEGLRAEVRITRRLGSSDIVQHVRLEADTPRLDLAIDVDWHERETLLKASFPLAIHARDHVAEVQFGHVRRPLHENTSWDFSRFEVPAQRWLLVEEPGYGAALLNDSTHGHDVQPLADGVRVSLSLMRAPVFPDPSADRSFRSLSYSLLTDADVVSAAEEGQTLNLPPRLVTAPPVRLADVTGRGIHVDAVLPAEDGSGDLVVRLHEGRGGRTTGSLRLGFDAERVVEVDPLEDPVDDPRVDLSGPVREIPLTLSPFTILTLRITPGGES